MRKACYTRDGKLAGIVEGRVFRKTFSYSRHVFKTGGPAIAIDAAVWNENRASFDRVEATDTESKDVYSIEAHHFEKQRTWIKGYRGHGEQYKCNLRHWTRYEGGLKLDFGEE